MKTIISVGLSKAILNDIRWYAKYKKSKYEDMLKTLDLENPDCKKNLETMQRAIEYENNIGALLMKALIHKGLPTGDNVVLELIADNHGDVEYLDFQGQKVPIYKVESKRDKEATITIGKNKMGKARGNR